jgi:amino acid adenylation domain-containing protein
MRSIATVFEGQVSANDGRLAVATARDQLTYRQLNQSANRLARAVLASVSRSSTVGVLVGHRASTIVAMLGILKAGRIVVPLDPRQPAPRTNQILADCEADALVTDQQNLPEANALCHSNLEIVNVDALDHAVSADNIDLPIAGDAPACLIYTSGSTGSPKGVVQTVDGLLNRSRAFADVLRVRPEDRLSLLASSSVAQGVSGALQALINGASVHQFDLREQGVAELGRWLAEQAITVLTCTPSTFRHFAKTLTGREEFPALRVIRLGSEQILPHDFELYRRYFSRQCQLVGTLGSTEAGPIATYVMTHDSDIARVVPAGYPVAGTTLRLLAEDGRPCPAGEAGEIVVHNHFLSLGYWRDPDRTAAAFVHIPGDPGQRFYRTGDIGVLRADGCLEYVGRKNLQVKIRGFRVELEEIERSLSTHALVLEAAVVARPDKNGEHRLAAYVVARAGRTPSVEELRTHLRNFLPEQMVPASIEFLESLPRTASGKVHRAAIVDGMASPIATAGRAPRDAVEMSLTTLWEDLLERHPIGSTDDFFASGGHSLLAARLSASIERLFGLKLPLAAFLTAATIERQAELIRARGKHDEWPLLVPIRTGGSKRPLFCVHLADGNVLSYRDLARHLPLDQPLYGLQSRGLDGIGRPHTRIEDMARDYVSAMRGVQPQGPYAICGWSFAGVVAFEIARQLAHDGETVEFLGMFDTRARRSTVSARRMARRTTVHTRALLRGRKGLSYARRRLRTSRRVLANMVWRSLMLWYGRGGWLPRRLRNVTQANKTARRDYVLQSYGGRMTMFRIPRPDGLASSDNTKGWREFVTGELDVHEVPGTHLTMVFEPHVQTLAATLTRCLEAARRAAPADDSGKAA